MFERGWKGKPCTYLGRATREDCSRLCIFNTSGLIGSDSRVLKLCLLLSYFSVGRKQDLSDIPYLTEQP